MATSTTKTRTRTITLTNRPPVRIAEHEWPVIAVATERPGSVHNGTPVPDYETDTYSLRVRQHADGRVIVYGRIEAATAWTGTEDWRGGELVTGIHTMREIVGAIRRVGADGGILDSVIRACIADLPAETL